MFMQQPYPLSCDISTNSRPLYPKWQTKKVLALSYGPHPGRPQHRLTEFSVLGCSSQIIYQIRQTVGKAKTDKMTGPDEFREYSGSSASMPFIISSNIEKADPATRKLIRSHVMRGRKEKAGRLDKVQQKMSQQRMANRTKVTRVKLEEVIKVYTPRVPDRVGSDLSFIKFADEVEQSVLLNITKG